MEKTAKELALSKIDVCRSDIDMLLEFIRDNGDFPTYHYVVEDTGDLPLVMSDYIREK